MERLRRASFVLVAAPIALLFSLVPADAHGPIDSADIVDQSIAAVDIGPDAVGTSEIRTSGVGKAEIANNAVGASEILANAVQSSEILAGAVKADEIATNAVGPAEIAANAVGSSEIAAGAVGTSELAAGAVTSSDIGLQAVDENALKDDIRIETIKTYTAAGSFQLLSADLTLDPAAGSSTTGDPDFLGGVMGNVFGNNLTATSNYIGGVIGHYSVTGTRASTYPVGAVLAGISDGTTTADGAFVAYLDGDSPTATSAEAAFKVMNNNSTITNGFQFGLDLQDEQRGAYAAVDEDFYTKAPLRLVRDVVFLVDDAAPVDGTTGDDVAGTGSLYIDSATGTLYINTGAITSPTWVKVGNQS